MPPKKKQQIKAKLHPRNRNREAYDLIALVKCIPELAKHIKPNKFGGDSLDFANPVAVKLLNKALLHYYYGIEHWNFPDDNLCPPIPGRADYIHYIADLLCENNFGKIPTGSNISCFDIGVGANCIYPILGIVEYGWHFIGSDVDSKSLETAQNIVEANPLLKGKVEFRLQENPKDIFYGVIGRDEKIDVSMCNPPYHSSSEDAKKESRRKVRNLSGGKAKKATLNFAGISSELIYDGGEHKFIHKMMKESKKYANNCFLFSTLVSKQSNLKGIYHSLEKLEAEKVWTKEMGTGNKSSRIVAWTFLTKKEQKAWKDARWRRD